jgi:UDP-glucose 4-epimerase
MLRILLTGATGFLGSYVIRSLLKHDCDIAILLRPRSNPWRITNILPRLNVIQGDLTDVSVIAGDIQAFAPDVTIHLAWHGVGNPYHNDPQQVINLHGSLSLLDFVHAAGCHSWVELGSQAEYGTYNHPVSESRNFLWCDQALHLYADATTV